ncbi:MAG: hypothetical protein Q7T20_09530 [Saprospiraceae bacterium]|nr:hypothetical protein [Saprospiraceae bacterium]
MKFLLDEKPIALENMFLSRKWLIIPILLSVSSPLLNAQNTYTLQWRTDLPLIGLGLGTSTAGWILGKKSKPLQPN